MTLPGHIMWSVMLSWFIATTSCLAQQTGKTIQLVSYKSNGRNETGTAFFIDQQATAVTCYHVIVNAYRIDAFPTNLPVQNVSVLYVDPIHDLATIRVLRMTHTASLRLRMQTASPLTKLNLKIFGYLNGDPNGEISVKATDRTSLKSGLLKDQGNKIFALEDVDIIPLDSLGYHGLSGSPLIDDDTGEVIGVFEGSLSQGGSQTWAIPISYLRSANSSQSIDVKTFDWPQLQLMKNEQVTRYARSLQLPPSFQKDIADGKDALEKYEGLLAQMDKIFDDCRGSSEEWNNIAQTLPDGITLPLRPEDITDFATFQKRYRLASDTRKRTCGAALSLYNEIADTQAAIKHYVKKAQDDLTATVQLNTPTQLPVGLIAETKSITQTVTQEIRDADYRWVSVNDALKKAQAEPDIVVSDTTSFKAKTKSNSNLDATITSDDVRQASKLDLDAITNYLSLVSDTISYLSTLSTPLNQ